jgi:hypothetical protein
MMPPMRVAAAVVALSLTALALAACRTSPGSGTTPRGDADADGGAADAAVGDTEADGAEVAAACPATAPAAAPLPDVASEHRTAAWWIERTRAWADPDEQLLSPERLADHDRALRLPVDGRVLGRTDLLAPVDRAAIRAETNGRLASLRGELERGEYVDVRGRRFGERELERLAERDEPPELRLEWRVALEPLEVRCGPTVSGFYTSPPDPEFDRNVCSSLRPQEPVQLLAEWDAELWLVRTSTVLGWLPRDAALSPPVPADRREVLVRAPRVRVAAGVVVRSDDGATFEVPARVALAPAPEPEGGVLFADRSGFHAGAPEGSAVESLRRPLTRRALLEEAFARLDEPYGWGGRGGGLDCSGFVQEVLASFDLVVPRYSGHQARAGTFSIEVAEGADEATRLQLLDTAARHGVVLLQFPGHILLYLGRTPAGTPMAIHSFSEFMDPCGGSTPDGAPRETLRRVDRVDVSTLELGRGSSRGSFLERLTRITVIGASPDEALAGLAEPRPAAPVEAPAAEACDDTLDVAVFRSPRQPHAGAPLRVIVTSVRPLEPVELVLVGPDGTRYAPPVHRLGGPPWAWWVELDAPAEGDWLALLGDGTRVETCETFRVSRHAPRPSRRDAEDPPWRSPVAWERDTEALYAAFVEQLFREPVGEEATWPDLQTLLRDPARNLLYDHLGRGEDERLRLVPDCADLPYFLRAYFAWKLRLPFAFRRCTRGRDGAPPYCPETPWSNLDPDGALAAARVAEATGQAAEAAEVPAAAAAPEAPGEFEPPADEVEAFERFITRVANSVHSATARTVPGSDASDLYPVPLTRAALAPGAVFADPYGHVLVVAAWLPQPLDGYGVLVGAEAQPDGTVGRRRFWRGSFLFDPDTNSVGAGFKAWRPAVYDRATGLVATPGNAALRGTADHPPFSEEQYRGSAAAFYDRMDALIQPRPLDPVRALEAVVAALEEAVVRRVVSVDNGERWVRENPGRTIEMPTGHEVFETEGPWEDYATPSRDMRLLIAIDAALDFPAAVARAPERYALAAGAEADAAVEELRTRLAAGLAGRRFTYAGSDGAARELSLQDVVDRRVALEAAYNPNDCVELRWGAPEGSAELGGCGRRAPDEQRQRMEEYRSWFHERRRPPR